MVNLGLADTLRVLRTQGYAKDFNLSEAVLDSKTGQLRDSGGSFQTNFVLVSTLNSRIRI